MLTELYKGVIAFLFGAISSFLGALIAFSRNKKKKNEALSSGVESLLRAEIIRSYEKYSERGAAPIYAKEAVKKIYAAYHDLGGNDVATDLYSKIIALPTDSDR